MLSYEEFLAKYEDTLVGINNSEVAYFFYNEGHCDGYEDCETDTEDTESWFGASTSWS